MNRSSKGGPFCARWVLFAARELALFAGLNKMLVHWPASATGFVLQEISTLNPPAWTDVADQPIEIGGQKLVIISPPAGNRFYRFKL